MSEYEVSTEDIQADLAGLAEAEAVEESNQTPSPAPEAVPAPEQGAPVNEAPAEGQAPEGTPEEVEVAPFNPDDLPEELKAGWKQLEAAYTPRLQEAAQTRRQIEALGGLDAAQQAVELAQWIQNPENWPAVYEEMYQAMQANGFEFEDDVPVAPSTPAGPQFEDLDPELAPIMSRLDALQAQTAQQQQQLEAFYAEQAAQREYAELEFQQMQRLSEMQRQVSEIRTANPSYTETDMKAIIELSAFYQDDIHAAQQRYESIVADRLSRYFEGKKAPAPVATQPVSGAEVTSHEDQTPETFEEAAEQAEELMRRLQAEGALDF